MKKVFIINGNSENGVTGFEKCVGRYVTTYKYSIIELPKMAAKILGWDGGETTADHKFLRSLKDLTTQYSDILFDDIKLFVKDFMLNKIDAEVLFLEMKDAEDIKLAALELGAETILIRSSNRKEAKNKRADTNIKKYKYDYIIENNGTLKQLLKTAKRFTDTVIKEKTARKYPKIISNEIKAVVFDCKKEV